MSSRPFLPALCGLAFALAVHGGDLKIHVINVGWGSAVLVQGPTGKNILLEAGNPGAGTTRVVPYLQAKGVTALDAIVLGHNHEDHSGGLPEVKAAGFLAPVNYYNGSAAGSSLTRAWISGVSARAMVPGDVIDLGDGAKATCIAANGRVMGSTVNFAAGNENDNSLALLFQYKGFDYLWESDLGGAPDAEDLCSGRSTSQKDVEVPMIRAISPGGASPLISAGGIDICHVGHHGSESSTHPVYLRTAKPEVALISTGIGNSSWSFPYVKTVDNVLLSGEAGCAGVAAPLVLQTEDGHGSTSGYAVGNIVIRTNGAKYWISANSDNGNTPYIASGNLASEREAAGIPLGIEREFDVDDAAAPVSGFNVAVAPSPLSLVTGGAARSVLVSLAAVNGFSGAVNLSMDATPGVTSSFSPAQVSVPGTATLTLQAAAGGSTASYQTSVRGVAAADAGKTAAAPLVVAVTTPPITTTFSETELNDTLGTANIVPATATSLVGFFPSTSDNHDWFKVTLPAGRTLAANMTGPTASSQDYDLYLTSSTGSILSYSEQSGTTESVSYKNTGTTTRTLYLHVVRYSSYSRVTPYTIGLTR